MKIYIAMRNKIVMILLATAFIGSASAQEFKTGDNVLSLGLGIGSTLGSYGYSSQTPAISIQYEHGQWDVGGPGTISLGGYLGFKSFKYESFDYSEKWNYTVIGIRSAYHYNGLKVEHLDVYGGLMLSYDIVSYSFESSNPLWDPYKGDYANSIGLSLYVGGRYYFSSNISGFLELGYGVSYLNIGGCYKF